MKNLKPKKKIVGSEIWKHLCIEPNPNVWEDYELECMKGSVYHEILAGPLRGAWEKTASTASLSSATVAVLETWISAKGVEVWAVCEEMMVKEKGKGLRTEGGTVEFEDGESEGKGGKAVVEEGFSGEDGVEEGEGGGGGGGAGRSGGMGEHEGGLLVVGHGGGVRVGRVGRRSI